MNIGERIKEVRKAQKMSMDAFGKCLGISKVSVSRLENGANNPSKQTILAICREFNISEEWLRSGTGEMHPAPTDDIDISDLRQKLIRFIEDMPEDELIRLYNLLF